MWERKTKKTSTDSIHQTMGVVRRGTVLTIVLAMVLALISSFGIAESEAAASPLPNPPLDANCGRGKVKMALAVELSGAMIGENLVTIKKASSAYVRALSGTDSEVSLFPFSTLSPANGAQNNHRPPTSVKTPQGVGQLTDWIDQWTASGNANWTDVLRDIAEAPTTFDLVIFMTYGSPRPDFGTHVEQANAVKSQGTRIYVVLVGKLLNNETTQAMQSISGRILGLPQLEQNDYFTQEWSHMEQVLWALAASCKSAPQKVNVTWVDDDANGIPVTPRPGTETVLTGGSGDPVGFTESQARAGMPDGYELKSIDNVATFDNDPNVDQSIVVHVVHKKTTSQLVVTRTIVYQGAGNATPATTVQSITWTVTKDEVTGETTYTTDATGYPAVPTPDVPGHHPDIAEVPALAVTSPTSTQPQSSTVTVTYTPGEADAAASTLVLDRDTQQVGLNVKATVRVKDTKGNPLPGQEVALSLTGSATFGKGGEARVPTTTCQTSTNGECSVTLTDTVVETVSVGATVNGTAVGGDGDPAKASPRTVTFTAGSPSVNPTCPPGKTGTNLSVDKHILSVGDKATATALVTDEYCNPVLGTSVTFSLDQPTSGVVTPVVVSTGADGKAIATLTDSIAETVKIHAHITAGEIPSAQDVTFTAGAFSHVKSTFTVTPVADPANTASWVSVSDGASSYTGTLTAMDAAGNPLPGLATGDIVFSASNPDVVITSVVDKGDGTYTVQFSSKVASADPKAQVAYQGTQVGQSKPIPFRGGSPSIETKCEPGKQGTNISASPTSVRVGEESTVSALVTDEFCNPLTGVEVSFSLVAGSSGTLKDTSVRTGADGRAATTVTDTVPEKVGINGAITPGQIPGSPVSVTFTTDGHVNDKNSTVTVDPTRQEAGLPVTVTVTVKDANGIPVAGLTAASVVVVGTSSGLPNLSVSGFTEVSPGVYTYSATSKLVGEFEIRATVSGVLLTDKPKVKFYSGGVCVENCEPVVPGNVTRFEMVDNDQLADGASKDSARAYAYDVNGNPVKDASVEVKDITTGPLSGVLNPSNQKVTTGIDGTAMVYWTSTKAGTFTAEGTVGGLRPATGKLDQIRFTTGLADPGTSELRVTPSSPIQVGNSYSAEVIVRDSKGNLVSGAAVSFRLDPSSPAVLSPDFCTTGASGTCRVSVTSKLVTEVDIHATLPHGGVPTDVNGAGDPAKASPQKVGFIAKGVCVENCDPVNPNNVTRVEVVVDGAEANGSATDVAKAFAYDEFGNPVAGAVVASTTTDAALSIQTPIPATGKDGTTLIEYRSLVAGAHVAEVKVAGLVPVQAVSSNGVRTDGSITLNFSSGTASAAHSSLSIAPSTPQKVGTVFAVTAHVADANANPVQGSVVSFPPVADLVFDKASCVSGSDGTCEVGVTSTVAGEYVVSARLGIQPVPNTVTAVFTAGDVCLVEDGCEPVGPGIDPHRQTRVAVTVNDARVNNADVVTVWAFDRYGNAVEGTVFEIRTADPVRLGNPVSRMTTAVVVSGVSGMGTLDATSAVGGAFVAHGFVGDMELTRHGSPMELRFLAAPVIVSPADKAVVNKDPLTIAGTGTIPGNTVVVTDDGTEICRGVIKDDLSWSCTASLADGEHSLVAVEGTSDGKTSGPSVPVVVTIDTKAPGAPTIVKPGDGSVIKDSTPVVSGTGDEPGNTVTVTDGGNVVCTTVVKEDKTWSCTADKPLTEGEHTLVAVETDKAGNVSGPSKPVVVTVDTQASGVPVILKPADGSSINNPRPEISGTGDEPGNTVTVTDGGTVVCMAVVKVDKTWSCTPDKLLTDGEHTFVATETDKAGNVSGPSKPVVVTVDTKAPNAPVIVKPGDGAVINNSKPEVSGTGDEPGNTVTVTDGGNVVCMTVVKDDKTWSCTADKPLAEGEHTLVAKETDKAGNVSGPSKPVVVTVDTQAPGVPTIVKPGDGSTINNLKPEISGTGDEPGNTVTVTDGGTAVCTAVVKEDKTWSCTVDKPLTEGEHTLVATETDKAGNTSGPSKPVVIVVDTQASGVPVILKPVDGSVINNPRPEISGTGEEPGSTITVTDGGTVVCMTVVKDDKTWSCITDKLLSEGEHTLVAKETDKAGNVSGPSKPVVVTVDTQAPGVPTIVKPGDGSTINNLKPEISGTGDEPGNTVTVTDGGTAVCTAVVKEDKTWSCTVDKPLTEGEHTLVATETDKAGNTSGPSKPVVVVVDTTAPGSPEILKPGDGSSINNPLPEISGKGDEVGNTITVTDGSNGGTVVCTTVVKEDKTWSCTVDKPLTEGEHTLVATETDKAGNTSGPSKPVVIVVDTAAPGVPTIVKPGDGSTINNPKPEILGTGDEPGNTVTVTDGGTVVCTAVVKDDKTWSCTVDKPLTEGEHTLVATETDKAGNTSGPSKPVVVVVDTTAPGSPEILKPGDGSSINDPKPEISGKGDEVGNTITVTDGGTVVCTTVVKEDKTWSCTGDKPLTEGEHTLVATETDKAGNTSGPSKPVVVVVDTTAPSSPEILKPGDGSSINDPKPEISGKGDEVGNTITVTDGGTVVCTTVVKEDKTWSCTVDKPLTEGEHTLVATETDKAGNTSGPSKPVVVVVDTTAPSSPEILKPGDGSSINNPKPEISGKGDEVGNTITVTDGSNGGTVVCTTVVKDDKTWSCTVDKPLTEGEHTLVAKETDKAGNTSNPSKPVTVVVDTTAPKAPVVDGSNGSTVTGTTEPGTTVTVTDQNKKPVQGCEDVKPDESGRFSCAPTTPLPPGTTVEVTAKDKAGNVSDPVRIVVKALVIEVAYPVRQPLETQIVIGRNFNANEQVCLTVGSDPWEVGCGKVGSDGMVSFTFTVPSGFPTGSHTVTLTGNSGSVSTAFEVVVLKPAVRTGGSVKSGPVAGFILAATGILR